MPKVKKGEPRNQYVSRAIPILRKEHPEKSQKQIVGMAEGMFTGHYGVRGLKKK